MSDLIEQSQGDNAEARPTGRDIEAGQVDVRLPGFVLTETGLVAQGTPSMQDVIETGAILARAYRAAQFGLADWIDYVRGRFGWTNTEIMTKTGMSYSTVTEAVWLGRRFPPDKRRAGVSASTHAAAASLRPGDRDALLDRAQRENLPRGEVRAIARAVRNGHADPDEVATVTVTTHDPRAAAWSLAHAFGDRLPLLVAELRKLSDPQEEQP